MTADDSKVPILAITDRVGQELTNGAQVFANALLLQLAQWFDLTVVAAKAVRPAEHLAHRVVVAASADDERSFSDGLAQRLRLDLTGLIYNLGATSFGCQITEVLRGLAPRVPLVNHFQVLLDLYSRYEGWSREEAEEVSRSQRALALEAQRNIFPSFSELRAATSRWGCPNLRSYVVPNAFVGVPVGGPVDVSRPFTFLAAGRFSDKAKGADLLYRAFAELLRAHPSVRLEVASDSRRFLEILERAPRESWTFLGWLDRANLLSRMRCSDAVVVPSRYEPFGLVAVEAMAMGTPVIAMAVGGLAETVWHGVTGWLCPAEEGSLGLRLAMDSAIRDGSMTRRLGQQARQHVEREYSLSRVAQQVRGHLRNALARDGRESFHQRFNYAP